MMFILKAIIVFSVVSAIVFIPVFIISTILEALAYNKAKGVYGYLTNNYANLSAGEISRLVDIIVKSPFWAYMLLMFNYRLELTETDTFKCLNCLDKKYIDKLIWERPQYFSEEQIADRNMELKKKYLKD